MIFFFDEFVRNVSDKKAKLKDNIKESESYLKSVNDEIEI